MKRSSIYFLTTIVLFAMVISCKKDDATPAGPSVVGTWKFTAASNTGCTDTNMNGSETCTLTLAQCGSLVLTATAYTFTPPTGSTDPVENGTYTISGTTLTSTKPGGGTDAQTFVVTATTLTLSKTDATTGCHGSTTFTRQ